MYYVNVEQMDERLAMIPLLTQACGELLGQEGAAPLPLLSRLAQERALHLAIELVTDVGSLLIDGFLLRDASSYEDIIEILRVESIFPDELVAPLQELVRLRKPLVQDYMRAGTETLHPLTRQLPGLLASFEASVRAFMAKELGPFGKGVQ